LYYFINEAGLEPKMVVLLLKTECFNKNNEKIIKKAPSD